jgi:hypothetical protein
MRVLGQRATLGLVKGRPASRFVTGPLMQSALIVAISAGLLWVVWLYTSGLRDARYLDGWALAAGMGVQLCFHITRKSVSLSPVSAGRWRSFHIFMGFLLIAAFASHSDFGLPDTAFEWALWAGFVVVTASGVFGTYLAWALAAKRSVDSAIGYERIPARRAELAQAMVAAVAEPNLKAADTGLPSPPYDDWIGELFANHLKDFMAGPRNVRAHLTGSQRHLKLLTGEIETLSRFVDQGGQEKLATIASLVAEKDQLDFAQTYLALTRAWLLIHVPATYGLIVLTLLHIIVAYAFSSGTW